MSEVVLATANAHKAREIRAALVRAGVDLVERPDHVGDVEETEATLEGNALLKARALCAATHLPALADDTGLFVDALDGRPGVHSARYAGPSATYEDNVALLLGEMAGAQDRSARFRTVIALVFPDGRELLVEGVLEGRITQKAQGEGGFGYDPVFAVDAAGARTLAELSMEEKNAISHRGRALLALVERLGEEAWHI